ncbi:MAG: hypothetical protein LBD72_02820 [Puniceicoccales bacterium]|jgi:hypothetical protein|nr:hypothetical protein [Puniceicoccales bacterium]
MPIKLITLRQSFDSILMGKNAIDFGALCDMIEIEDSYNAGAYILDDTIASDIVLMNNYETDSAGNPTVYYESVDADGQVVFNRIITLDEFIPASDKLYLKKRKLDDSGGGAQDDFVLIYSLRKLDTGNFRTGSTYRSYYRDTASRIAAILYAMCCYQKKLLQLHIRDIEAVNREQKELNRISSLISVIQNDLREKDTGVDDVANRHSSTIYADIIAFFILHGFFNGAASGAGSAISIDTVNLLRCILEGNEAITNITVMTGNNPINMNTCTIDDLIKAFEYGKTANPALFRLYNSMDSIFSTRMGVTMDDIWEVFGRYYGITRNAIATDNLELCISTNDGNKFTFSPGRFADGSSQISEYADLDQLLLQSETESPIQVTWRVVPGDSTTEDPIIRCAFNLDAITIRWEIFQAAHGGYAGDVDRLLWDFVTICRDDIDLPDDVSSEEIGPAVSDVLRYVLYSPEIILYETSTREIPYTTIGGRTMSFPDSVRAWMQFQMLIEHYNVFFGADDIKNRFLPDSLNEYSLDELDLDPFSGAYWVKASDAENNTFKGVIAFGDHWVFDPRIRKKDGTFLLNDNVTEARDARDYIYVRGFSAINTGKGCENLGNIYNNSNTKVGTSEPTAAENYSPEYSVSWFNKNPPTSAADFENGVAGILSRSYGGRYFMNDGLFVAGNDGRKKFSDQLKNALVNGDKSFTIEYYTPKNASAVQCFYISAFDGNENSAGDAEGTKTSAARTINEYKAAAKNSYWLAPKDSGTYADVYVTGLKGIIEDKTSGTKINAEQSGMFCDTIRIHADQINNHTTALSTGMQMDMHFSQQSLNMATNIMKAIYRTMADCSANIR